MLASVASQQQMAQNQEVEAKAKAAQAAQQQALQAKYMPTAEQQTIADLNSGNYGGAWSTALGTSGLYNTTYGAGTTDPLLADMESSQGLEQLDPTKQWNQQSIDAYYQALANNPVYKGQDSGGLNGTTESLGEDPSGLWGQQSDILSGKDAAANISADGANAAPNVEQFAGAQPKKSFLSKYGADIGALAATALTMGAAAPAMAAAMGGSLAATVGAGAIAGGLSAAETDAITGRPLTLGSVAGGALGGAATGGLTSGLGSAVNSATGLGSTASDALVGAGVGAAKGELTGQGALGGAISGGIGGAIQGSGIVSTANQALQSAGLPSAAAGALTGGVLGAGTGAIGAAVTGKNALTGAEVGGAGGVISGGLTGAGASPLVSGIGGTIGSALLGQYLNTPNTPKAAPAAAPTATTPPATSNTQPIQQQPTPTTGAAPQNIGAYSGYPQMQQQQPQNINYNTYGQGPEAQFFTGESNG